MLNEGPYRGQFLLPDVCGCWVSRVMSVDICSLGILTGKGAPCLMSAIVVSCELCRLINSRVGVGGGPDWGRCLLSDVLRLLCFASYVSSHMLVGILTGDGASCLMSAVVVFREMSVNICRWGARQGWCPCLMSAVVVFR